MYGGGYTTRRRYKLRVLRVCGEGNTSSVLRLYGAGNSPILFRLQLTTRSVYWECMYGDGFEFMSRVLKMYGHGSTPRVLSARKRRWNNNLHFVTYLNLYC